MSPLHLYPDIVIRLGAAIIFGGAIGLEREFHGRPAGIRTHILVCMGATMIMLLPRLLFTHDTAGDQFSILNVQGRIIAGIVTGIGFLGAGAIIRIGDMVRGLTTAAGIWFTAALGAVTGAGYLLIAAICTIMGIFITIIFEKVEDKIKETQYRELIIKVDPEFLQKTESNIEKRFPELKIVLLDKYYKWDDNENLVTVKFMIKTKDVAMGRELVLSNLDSYGIKSVSWQKSI